MANPLARKLRCYVRLTEADEVRLADALGPPRRYAARTDIIEEGDDPRAVNIFLDGWACRYRQLRDGRRQIVSLILPGDPCDPHVFLFERMDHAIGAITPVTLAQIPGRALEELAVRSPTLDRAFIRDTLANAAVQREWTVSLGRRSAFERLAHLFCELHTRLAAVGLTDRASCPLPMTQTDLADALGQTAVHINRTLRDLRAQGLVTVKGRRLVIHDMGALAELAHFDPTYLHFTVEHR